MQRQAASMPDVIGYALIGGGGFGRFAGAQYQALDQVRLRAVADADVGAAQRAADELGVTALDSIEAVCARDDVQLVHIATPPWTHRALVESALRAGKHVLCEKPLALSLADASAMLALAAQRGLLLATNLLMRYNPLCAAVKRIIEQGVLGAPLHAFFENYAKDEPLPPDHWFWDPTRSGGIFVEHGVHFFDLFAWWLGEPTLAAAQAVRRPDAPALTEQVQCTARYPGDVLVNFYHSFTQAERMDRQEMRLVFERGTLRLFEWVPTTLDVDAILTQAELDTLGALLPNATVSTHASYSGAARAVTSRHRSYEVDGRYHVTTDTGMDKETLYGHVLRGLLSDQLAALRDPAHARRVSEANGYSSLRTAIEAQRLADAHAG